MIEVERKRIGKESVRGKIKMILKCVLGFVAWLKSCRKKVVRSLHSSAFTRGG